MLETYIYGAGGLGKSAHSLIRRLNRIRPRWNICGYLDDSIPQGTRVGELSVLGPLDFIPSDNKPKAVVLAIADPKVKQKGHDYLASIPGVTFPTLVDPLSHIDEKSSIGDGAIVLQYATVAVDTHLGSCVLVNTGAHIGSDCTIGNFSSIMPAASLSGNNTVGTGTFIATHTAVRPYISIGSGCIVDMCSLVLSDVPDNNTVMGQPAVPVAQAAEPVEQQQPEIP